ncbi:uncharacterized protein TA20010 [Theileria annulata]|uniref:Uncharacterized protein n=1 Tax=Theileria annulata TaxID=5874 RepID=Q4UG47_THEAN|nr:uncharacterized protein TA20010 [Theileria annulata]CAI73942.1 hypothetical protein TA20010 [Theileria annulata]|eukprot:XP_954619.1 hypothetical protein TA20010 [Theileria annulata]
MDLSTPLFSDILLEGLSLDSEVFYTCQRILHSYSTDTESHTGDSGDESSHKIADEESIRPSPSYISSLIKTGPEGIKKELEKLNQCVSALDSLMNKGLLNKTTEIVQSFEEVNDYKSTLESLDLDLKNLNEGVISRYKSILTFYNSVETGTTSLDRLRSVYLYSLECRRIILFLKGLHEKSKKLKSTVRDFLEMLLVATKCMLCLDKILNLEKTEGLLKVMQYCEDLKNYIVKFVYNYAYSPLFELNEGTDGSGPNQMNLIEPEKDVEKIVVISHVIYRELSVSSKGMLDLVERLVYHGSTCIDMTEVMSENNYEEWQGIFMSQVSQFFLKYVRNQKSLYFICKCSKYSLLEKLDKIERETISQYLETYVHEDQKEPFSLLELYTKRSIAFLQSTLSKLYSNDRYDVVMLVPQLISLGDSMHEELAHINIPFNIHRYYYKTLCEDYAKSFVSIAAKKIIPVSKTSFLNCIRALPTLESSPPALSTELNQATHMLMNLPVDNELWNVISEFLEKSKMCPSLFKQICAIVSSALETVFGNISEIKSYQGTKLSLSDGGSKITLVKPNDCQVLNARLFMYVFTIVDGIESNLSSLIPPDSNLLTILDYGKSIELVSGWSDDISNTIWHILSYISVDNLEFNWTCHQVNIATNNLVKILNFLKDSYFDPLLPVGKIKLLLKFCSITVASFLIYSITTWPLNDDERLSMINFTTELEFSLSDLLHQKLGKPETDYFSFLKRLIFLSDDELSSVFSQHTPFPKDVLLLHIACRLIRDNSLNEVIYKHLNYTSVHFMLLSFRNSLLQGPDPDNLEKLHKFLSTLCLNLPLYNDVMAHLTGF